MQKKTLRPSPVRSRIRAALLLSFSSLMLMSCSQPQLLVSALAEHASASPSSSARAEASSSARPVTLPAQTGKAAPHSHDPAPPSHGEPAASSAPPASAPPASAPADPPPLDPPASPSLPPGPAASPSAPLSGPYPPPSGRPGIYPPPYPGQLQPSGGMPMPGGSYPSGPGGYPSGPMSGSPSSGSGQTASVTPTATIPAVFSKMYGADSITIEGSYIVLKSKGRPSLESPYYKDTEWEDELYTAYHGDDGHFNMNPFVISEYDFELRIPLNPTKASSPSTYKGTIGMAVDGVAIFDRYTSSGALVTEEQLGFDQNNAHPTPKNIYHYHLEPTGLTRTLGKDALLGFLLDGFPLYGPEENGKTITNSDLDSYHGHFGETEDYPDGVYHYHVTAEEPFILGTSYYGKPGMIPR